jgi:hypothetical protein
LNFFRKIEHFPQVLFLPQREIMVTETKVEPLMGVALIHQVPML